MNRKINIPLLKGRQDSAPEVVKALQPWGRVKNLTIEFNPGKYHFFGQSTWEQYCWISNNSHGMKRIAFPIIGAENLIINGKGAKFIFHGEIIPFAILGSKNISLKNLSIDWHDPFLKQAKIVSVKKNQIDLKLLNKKSYNISGGKVFFKGENWESPIQSVNEFDYPEKSPTVKVDENFGAESIDDWKIKELKPGELRLNGKFRQNPTEGNLLVIKCNGRTSPGIFIDQSNKIEINNVQLHHAGAMGLIAQKSRNITLEKYNVCLPKNSRRCYTAYADGAHFVNCKGLIKIKDCLFENQTGDALNIHGIYAEIVKKITGRTLLLKYAQEDQQGFQLFEPGDKINLTRKNNLHEYCQNEIEQVRRINSIFTEIILKNPVKQEIVSGDVIGNLTWNPDVEILNSTFKNNTMRGLLLSVSGNVKVENNNISSPGSAIRIAGDATTWYESGYVRNVDIRNNRFIDMDSENKELGKAVIQITPEITKPKEIKEPYHRKINIINNNFKIKNHSSILAVNTDKLTFSENKIDSARIKPGKRLMPNLGEFYGCTNLKIENNEATEEFEEYFIKFKKEEILNIN